MAGGHGLGAGEMFHRVFGSLLECCCHLSAMASSFSRDSTTSRVGSTRTAPSRSKPLSSWLTRWRDAPSSCARSSCASCQADADFFALRDAVALGQQQQLARQPGLQRARVEVLELVEHQPQAAAVQPQQRVVQLHVLRSSS
jgi:hypothetical protein